MASLFSYRGDGLFFHHSYDEHPAQADFKMHMHEMNEIYCFVSGSIKYVVEGRTYIPEPGSVILMRSAETHRLLVDGDVPYERYSLHFSDALLADAPARASYLAPFCSRPLGEGNYYRPSAFADLKPADLFAAIARKSSIDDRTRIADGLMVFLDLLVPVFEKRKDAPAAQGDIADEIIDYLNRNLSEELSLERIAAALHISVSLLCRAFRQKTGTTVSAYVRQKRLIAANQLIKSGCSKQAAAQLCGFGDYSTYYRANRGT